MASPVNRLEYRDEYNKTFFALTDGTLMTLYKLIFFKERQVKVRQVNVRKVNVRQVNVRQVNVRQVNVRQVNVSNDIIQNVEVIHGTVSF